MDAYVRILPQVCVLLGHLEEAMLPAALSVTRVPHKKVLRIRCGLLSVAGIDGNIPVSFLEYSINHLICSYGRTIACLRD